jgi:pimeloyl-ACP methyl ester carboxylesterase
MEPLYFGPDRRLFGVFHAPQPGAGRTTGVVLCQPIGHEYLRAHRAFRNLALQLARQGFPVLRFDYSGTGDSAGDGSDARLSDWTDDVSAAIDELKRAANPRRLVLVGMRFGAAVGALAASRRRDVDAVVLVDPVVNGAAYLKHLVELHATWGAGRGDGADAPGDFLVGFPFSENARADIAGVNLAALNPALFPRVSVFVSDAQYVDQAWAQGIGARYGAGAFSVVPPAAGWELPHAIHTPIVLHAVTQSIAAAVAAV